MKRIIVHSDLNHCYAQIEEMKYPMLRDIPMAVGGSVETRSGIILAKNDLAKKYQIKTGESVIEAKKKCPALMILPPSFEEYTYYCEKVKAIYRKYSDRVESFGLDEAWIDLTYSSKAFGNAIELARKIQDEVYEKYGLSVSTGVSFNKVFAKLASDIDKNKGFVVIDEEHYRQMIWPRNVKELLMVGNSTLMKLNALGIYTIGDLANASGSDLVKKLGKMGATLWQFANGLDQSEVKLATYQREIKSIGNSKTLIHDIHSFLELYKVFCILSESVATRLKEASLKGYVVAISLRDCDLHTFTRQKKLMKATSLAKEILKEAFELAKYNYDFNKGLRSVGISISMLVADEKIVEQLSLFQDNDEKQAKIEGVMEEIRGRYGFHSIKYCGLLEDEKLCDFDPKGTHNIHPIAYS